MAAGSSTMTPQDMAVIEKIVAVYRASVACKRKVNDDKMLAFVGKSFGDRTLKPQVMLGVARMAAGAPAGSSASLISADSSTTIVCSEMDKAFGPKGTAIPGALE